MLSDSPMMRHLVASGYISEVIVGMLVISSSEAPESRLVRMTDKLICEYREGEIVLGELTYELGAFYTDKGVAFVLHKYFESN